MGLATTLERRAAESGVAAARPRSGLGVQLMHPDLESRIDAWLAERGESWRRLLAGEVQHAGVPLPIVHLQILLIHADSVIWGECYFVERHDESGRAWRFFDYQKPSARYRGNTVHECGAEVGKTRELILLTAWLAMGNGPRRRGGILVAAAQDGHLDTLYDELLFQLRSTSFLNNAVDWDASRVKPYKRLVFTSGNVVDFRPGGYDGEAFRGLHAGLAILADEVAKWANRKIYDEFFRSQLPGAEQRLYSTPDGNRDSRFFDLCQAAIPAEEVLAELGGDPRRLHREDQDAEAPFVKFRWSKPQMPDPFWSEARRHAAIEKYGGVDSPGYQHNVLGNWGDAENSVFPWERFEPCCRYVPEYVEVKVLRDDSSGSFHVEAYRLNPTFEVSGRIGDESSRGAEALLRIFDQTFDVANFDLQAVLNGLYSKPRASLVGGIDCGSTDDPTEILFVEPIGRRRRIVARLQLKRYSYPEQRTAIRLVDQIFEPSHGYGLDATGVGTALEHLLVEGEGNWSLEGRLSGFVMNARAVDLNPETGEAARDPHTNRERRVTYKEQATRLLELGVQRREWEFPRSPDFLKQFPNHTARQGPSGERIFARENDHLIEATRTAELRLFELDHGDTAPPIVYAIPRGCSRPRLDIGA